MKVFSNGPGSSLLIAQKYNEGSIINKWVLQRERFFHGKRKSYFNKWGVVITLLDERGVMAQKFLQTMHCVL